MNPTITKTTPTLEYTLKNMRENPADKNASIKIRTNAVMLSPMENHFCPFSSKQPERYRFLNVNLDIDVRFLW